VPEQPTSRGPALAAYYDRLALWTAVARVAGYGGGRGTLTVHRALADPLTGGRPTTTRLHDVLAAALPPLTEPRVLDAGCGLGGTMIDLASRIGGTYTGLTVSERQARIGRRAAGRLAPGCSVQFLVRSYDTPPEDKFDLIVAIESLAHSADPASTVAGLSRCLAPGGLFAIVDDMPDESHSGPGASDLAAFKSGWQCPVLWSAADYRAALSRLGLTLLTDLDLTSHVSPRSIDGIRQLERLNRLMHRAIPSRAWRTLLDSYRGGLALERLYRQGVMRYRLLVAGSVTP
jgi:SAM-dependent methyltransferase